MAREQRTWPLEGNLLSGPKNSYIATLVERHTRYVMLAKVRFPIFGLLDSLSARLRASTLNLTADPSGLWAGVMNTIDKNRLPKAVTPSHSPWGE
jgi:hypothetical protein